MPSYLPRFCRGILLLAALLGPALPAAAQSPQPTPTPPAFEGDEVTVVGRRPQPVITSPAYVTVIDGTELRRLGFVTVADALEFLAEVYVRTSVAGPGGLQQASIRGTTPQQVLVLLDGVLLNATAQFGVNLATISLAEVERIEVLRGPYSAIHGSGALGGVIQIVTRRRAERVAYGAFGAHGTAHAGLTLGGGGPVLLYTAGAEYLSTAGDRPNSDAIRWTAAGRFVLNYSGPSTLTLSVHHTAGRAGLPGTTYFPSADDRLADGRTVVTLTWTHAGGGEVEQQARVWWFNERLGYTSPGYASDSEGSAHGAQWQRVARLEGGGILTLGVEWQWARYRFDSTFGGFAAESHNGTAYAQYDFPWDGRTLVGVGLRYDLHSLYGPQLNPRLGFVHFLGADLRLRGGIGRTFRGPTFGELTFPGCSNPNLKPETAWSADLGLEYAPAGWGAVVRLNGFYTDAQNLIVGGCDPHNVGSARVAGLSAEVVGRIDERWMVRANATWSDAIDRQTGLALLRLPRWTASLIARYEIDRGAAVSLLTHYVGERDDLDFSTFPAKRVTLGGYWTFGARYEHSWSGWTLRLGVDNLFDARYETLRGYPAAGRTYFVYVSSSF
ncbi:MAG: TonB-dependent receptor [Armatimonadota bacterium]|nr:TonB-dependent receptor [Armatimonadota bacterium]MDR5697527.1 TonB-dependent receptor [Armatimonadota bacterium]